MITSVSGDSLIRWTAGPESTACVAQAATLLAPAFMRAPAAFTRVPAVSIMSSRMRQRLPSTSPMMCITSLSFARSRRLSMIASEPCRRFAYARARSTPPASGETSTTSFW